jgi:hypothetical protein
MFELPVLVGLIATVFCFLKGRWRAGLGAIGIAILLLAAMLIRGAESTSDPSQLTSLLFFLGVPVWAVVSLILAMQSAEPGSFWDRRSATDVGGNHLLAQEPFVARLGRSVLGAFLGLLPAVVFMVAVLSTLEGDDAQIGFIGLPFGLLGLLFGGWIGFDWLPKGHVAEAHSARQPV